MEYRVSTNDLFGTLEAWDQWIPGRIKVHLIACGGTALTLLGHKESTKDVDYLMPNLQEYEKLTAFLEKAGYEHATDFGWKKSNEAVIYDLFPGKKVYTTELLTSPLVRGGNKKVKEWKKIYLGVLNPIDLIISKMFRGTQPDLNDCLILLKGEKVNKIRLEKRYRETAKYDVGEEKALRNLEILWRHAKEKR